MKNAFKLLRKTIESERDNNIFIQAGPQVPKSNPMSAMINVSAYKAVENYIERSSKLNSSWQTKEQNSILSVCGFVQIFSDKSQTISMADGLAIYALHITLLNFTDQIKCRQIFSGDTVVAYLLVSFHKDFEQNTAFRL